MIKLLMVVGSNVMNGTERYVVDIAKKLPKDEFDVWVATAEHGPLSEILKENKVNEYIYSNGKLNKFTFKGIINLLKFCRKNKFDVIHANASIIPCIIGKFIGVKLRLETKHGLFFTEEMLQNVSLKSRLYEKAKGLFVTYFISISHNDKDRLVKYFKINPEKIVVLYNGLDRNKLSEYKQKRVALKSEGKSKFIVGNIGRLTYQKAQDVLVNAFAEFCKVDNNSILRIIGSGEDKEMIAALIKKCNINDRVELWDYKKDIFNYFIELDILLLTSRFEGVPYVLLEAMELGIPVITTDVGGISNVLTDGEDSLIVETDNVQQIKDALVKVVSDPDLYNKISSTALKTISKYSLEDMVSEYVKLYKGKFNFE